MASASRYLTLYSRAAQIYEYLLVWRVPSLFEITNSSIFLKFIYKNCVLITENKSKII